MCQDTPLRQNYNFKYRTSMKTKFFALFFVTVFTLTLNAQEKTRSYFCQQTNGPANTCPIATINQATFVEWLDDNTIKMMDGTVWKYQGMNNGCHVYAFQYASGMVMPNTQYQHALFSADYSMMQVYYVFGVGMPGFAIQMNSFYKYIGEGRQPALDWMSGKFG